MSVLLISWLVVLVDWGDFLDRLKKCDLALLAVVQICLFLFPWLSAVKWRRLLAIGGLHFRRSRLTRFYLIAGFFNNFLPTSIGGDVVRVLYTTPPRRHGADDSSTPMDPTAQPSSLNTAVAAVILERLTGVIALMIICWVAASLSLLFGEQHAIFGWILLAGSAMIVTYALASRLLNRLRSFDAFRRIRIPKFLASVAKTTAAYPVWGKRFRPVWLLSFIFQGAFVLMAGILTQAIGIEIGLLSLFVIVPLRTLIMVLPVSLNGLGLGEAAYVVLFTSFGVSPEEGLLMSVVERMLVVPVSLVGGILYAFEGWPGARNDVHGPGG